MDERTREFVAKVGDYANVSMEQIMAIAQAAQYADFSNENEVRNLVRKLANVAQQPLAPDVEQQIVEAILRRNIPTSLDELQDYFK